MLIHQGDLMSPDPRRKECFSLTGRDLVCCVDVWGLLESWRKFCGGSDQFTLCSGSLATAHCSRSTSWPSCCLLVTFSSCWNRGLLFDICICVDWEISISQISDCEKSPIAQTVRHVAGSCLESKMFDDVGCDGDPLTSELLLLCVYLKRRLRSLVHVSIYSLSVFRYLLACSLKNSQPKFFWWCIFLTPGSYFLYS